jgi:serine/threonine protein kinase
VSPPSPPPAPKGAPPAGDVTAGSRLGKYEILKRLATGGMAEIFLARVSGLPGFQKMVVIKRILPQLATKSDFIEMFLDEARIAATLQHPNVVQMYDVGVVDGNYFIAMEYLHGEDVRSIMKTLFKREEKLPLEHALNIMIGVCSGLHYAHEKVGFDGKPLNIIHRDVTPQNIIVTYEGGVKLLDFGIAKASNRFGETRFGTLKGKVPYMSPEQCRGEQLDRRSDIFSLGIMLYELTLGKRLYQGASDFEILKQIVEGRITPPHELDPAYNAALEKIVMKALEKDRSQRFQTARELQAELETLVRESRLYVSPIALQQFLEHVFGLKIEAWREAQARGQSLGDHLQEVRPEDGEETGAALDPAQAEAEKRAAEERAALRRAIDQSAGADGVVVADQSGSLPRLNDSGSSPSIQPYDASPRRSKLPIALVATGVIAFAGVAIFKMTSKPKAIAPTPVAVAPQPIPAPPPPTPKTPIAIAKVKTVPTGAILYLDGKKLDVASPATLDGLDAGTEHVLLAQLDGYDDAIAHFTLSASEVRTVELTLNKPLPGKQAKHEKPKASRSKSGSHSVVATPTHPVVATPAPQAAEPPRPEPKRAEPKPEPPAKLEGEGTLVIASSPWCNVSIDGVSKGPTPVSAKLPAGKHTVVLTNPEFNINRTLPVMVMPNETVRKKLDFAQ